MLDAVLVVLPLGALYAIGAARSRWPLRRSACFMAGVAALAAAAALGEEPLARHMAAHALIVCAAAPLLVLGAPVTLALRALPRDQARSLSLLFASRPVRALSALPVAWLAFVAVQLAFHLTPLFDAALSDPILHALEHGLFLITALLFWDCTIGIDPMPRPGPPVRAAFLLTAMPAMDVSGVYLMAQGHGSAGAAMMAGSMPLALAGGLLFWRWLAAEEATARRREALGAAG